MRNLSIPSPVGPRICGGGTFYVSLWYANGVTPPGALGVSYKQAPSLPTKQSVFGLAAVLHELHLCVGTLTPLAEFLAFTRALSVRFLGVQQCACGFCTGVSRCTENRMRLKRIPATYVTRLFCSWFWGPTVWEQDTRVKEHAGYATGFRIMRGFP